MYRQDGWPAHCAPVESTRSLDFQFENLPNSFDFVEQFEYEHESDTSHHSSKPKHFENKQRGFIGTIHILPAPENQTLDLVVAVSINASNAFLTEHVGFHTTDSSVSLILPSPWKDDSHSGCLVVEVSMFFRQNLTLKQLSISSDLSNIEVIPQLGLVVGVTNIHTKLGTLTAHPFFASRITRINIDAGSVRGEYGLYDVLSITTKAGSIEVDVLPKPIDKDHPALAIFSAFASSGHIDVAFPPANTKIPERDYLTVVKTDHGSIKGCYIHSTNTSLSTKVGSITAKILPFIIDSSAPSSLATNTDAGMQEIEVLSPYNKKPITNLSSKHLTALASLKITYPDEWEGFIDGQTKLGSLGLEGSRLKVIEEGSIGFVGHYVKAERGDGNSTMLVRSAVGGAKMVVG
jgi:hypothetical protein